MIEVKKLEKFGVVCKKCGGIAKIEIHESVSYINGTCFPYMEAVCHYCHIRESLK